MSRLLITLPVYNESYILEQSLRTLYGWCNEHLIDFDWQILIADNGSTDSTLARAYAAANVFSRVSVFHTDEKGRGQVLRRAWLEREADYYTYMDVDLAVDLKHFKELVDELKSGTDLAIGSRLVDGAQVDRSFGREILSRGYNFLTQLALAASVKDTQCGFKGISCGAAQKILPLTKNDGWFWDTELLIIGKHLNFSIKEIPVEWVEKRNARRKSTVKILSTIVQDLRGLLELRRRLRK